MQTSLVPYLTFNGNCREAMSFYQACLGGELELMPFGEAPMELPAGSELLIMHAVLKKDDLNLMASDSMPDQPVNFGNNVSLSLNCQSKEEADAYFQALSAGGTITMPLEVTFWNAYFGMLVDKFGVCWMFNYDLPQQ